MDDTYLDKLRNHTVGYGGRLYLGAAGPGLALGDPQQGALVLGPPRSGKTTAVAVPNVLAAPGPVVATSTKPDLFASTAARRETLGRCWLLDPSGALATPDGLTRLRWSPVAGATSWDEALLLARAMTRAARPAGHLGESAHWTERAEALLAPLIAAAHAQGVGMDAVTRWVLRQDLDSPRPALVGSGLNTAADVLSGIGATDPREQSGIWSSAAGVLAAYRSDAALDNAASPNFDPAAFVKSRDTVYVCAPARHQEVVAPIVVAFVETVRAAAYAASTAAVRGVPRPAPLTLVLDEVANIAPLPDLPSMVSEGGSQGVITLACIQDLSQARHRWGQAADGFLTLFGAKLVLPGIADMATLELVSRLGGELDVPAPSVARSPWWSAGGRSETVTWSLHRQRRLPVESVREQAPGTAVLLTGARPPEKVSLHPWWAIAPFRESRVPRPSAEIAFDHPGL